MSINHFLDKIKGTYQIQAIDKTAIVYLLIIAGAGIGAVSFGLLTTRIGKETDQRIVFTQTPDTTEEASAFDSQSSSSLPQSLSEKNYVASKNGKLYYTAGCSAAKRIKPANQVWFSSAKEAIGLGYTLSKTCK